MIQCRQLSKIFVTSGKRVVGVDGIEFQARPGEFILIRGASGCGKTTLLLMLGGMLRPSSGALEVNGVDPYALTSHERGLYRRREIGFVFQMFHLIPYLSVRDNVRIAGMDPDASAIRSKATHLLEELGLGDRLDHTPSQLSAGEKQRVAVARSLINSPSIILADEPTGNLDSINAKEIFRRLHAFKEKGGLVVVVSHGEFGSQEADRVLEMEKGTFKN